jgi:hypothetical protein
MDNVISVDPDAGKPWRPRFDAMMLLVEECNKPEIDSDGIWPRRSSVSWVFAVVRLRKRSRFTLIPPDSLARPPWIL